ncbi:MAG: ferrochelatase [Flavobacteriales bacterium BRH_c54]|nr:MAG: ferrochelatase [Flavobacteriales bacterium BRH_c54]
MSKKGILLVNLGTPNSYETTDVRKYLREFLMDKYVIDLPYLTRWFLVNVIIATFRAPKSAKIYKQLWTKEGSPLLVYGKKVRELLQQEVGNDAAVYLAMRYQNPSIKSVLKEIKKDGITDLVVIPLYPQYASSSTKSSIEKVKEELTKANYQPKVTFIENFLSNEKFIEAFAENGNNYWKTGDYQKVLFSYHGIPERHILKDSEKGYCQLNNKCCSKYSNNNRLCYRAQCYETSRLIATKMGLKDDEYEVAFQSRLETRARDPWLKPYSDLVTEDLAKSGVKNVLCFSPSFIADCLETTIEVGEEFKEIFHENGGEKWQLVESLNDNPKWIEALKEITLSSFQR